MPGGIAANCQSESPPYAMQRRGSQPGCPFGRRNSYFGDFVSLLLAAQLEAGKVRVLAATRRMKQFSNVPTIAESGYTDISRRFLERILCPRGNSPAYF